MIMKKYLLLLLLFGLQFGASNAQSKINQDSIAPKMKWFEDAKLGIFIHWGIYAVNGISESWSFHNKRISHDDYMKQLNGFTAKNYDPAKWAELIKESGAQYCVMTTKHHDGVALWDTKANDLSIAKKSAAQKDVLTPFFAELRKRDVKVGAYFSLIDWTDGNYPEFLKDKKKYDMKAEPEKWNTFLKFYQTQISELANNFNPDLYWFDGDWEHSAEEWQAPKVRKMILDRNPNAIINGRLQGYGDYDTPEQNFPVSRPNLRWWELCMTTNESWGYQTDDTTYKTPYEIISIYTDAISMGGNLLLDIGPKEDGTITPEQTNILQELGKWNKKHAEAIFSTLPGMPPGHFYGASTISKDSTTLFLFVPGKQSGTLALKGISNEIKSIKVLGTTHDAPFKLVGKISWSQVPGIIFIDVPEKAQDKYMTVLKVELAKPLSLYRGKGGLY